MITTKMGITIIIFCVLVASVKPNMWDNLMTNYDAPEVQIATEKYVSFRDKLTMKEIFRYAHSNNYNNIRIITSNIQDVDTEENIYINFSLGIMILVDKDSNCTTRNFPLLRSLTVSFLLLNYDLVAYIMDPEKSDELTYLITEESLSADIIKEIINWIMRNNPVPVPSLPTRNLDQQIRGDTADEKAKKAALAILHTDKNDLTLKSLDVKFRLNYFELLPQNLDLRNLNYTFFSPICKKSITTLN